MMNMANLNASAKDDDPNLLYLKRRTSDGKHHTVAKLDPREFDGRETLHAAALRLCKSALAENQAGTAVVVSLKKQLSGLTILMLRTICNSGYEPEFDMEEDYDEDDRDA